MKTATLPPIRVDPKVKKQLESVLEPGETLSSFMLRSAVKTAAARREQRDFIARGVAGERRAERTGRYLSSETVFKKLEGILAKAKRERARRK